MARRPPVTLADALQKRPEVRVRQCIVRVVSKGLADVMPVDGITMLRNVQITGGAIPTVRSMVLVQTIRGRQQVISSAPSGMSSSDVVSLLMNLRIIK